MKHRLRAPLSAALLVGALAAQAMAVDTVFVNDPFDYADQSAFEAQWVPRAGDGFSAAPGPGAVFVPSGTGVTGQTGGAARGPAGLINEQVGGFDPVINSSGYLLQPSASQNVVVRGDIYAEPVSGPTIRQSIGLRSDRFDRNPDPAVTDFGVNFVELGFWNSAGECIPVVAAGTCNPGDPAADPPVLPDANFRPETDFAFRLVLFDSSTLGHYFENGVDRGQMVQNPNWQFFPLDPALDLPTTVLPNGSTGNGNGIVNFADIGEGWHTFSATIGATETVLTLDLFRDGINNATGLPGVDSTVVVQVAPAENFNNPPFKFDPAPFNSLRIGAPSGVTSDSGQSSFDNLYLALKDVVAATQPGDFNGDGRVDSGDLSLLLANWGAAVPPNPSGWTGSLPTAPGIDSDELSALLGNWGVGASTAVPEPGALALALAAAAVWRRRR